LRRGVDILIATPGRLLDLMNQRYVHLDQIKMLILDEADRMLDMGFVHDVKKIIAKVPANRQTLFFSATMPNEIQQPGRYYPAKTG
jgi:ATP-dependent RNA helicase RhlE